MRFASSIRRSAGLGAIALIALLAAACSATPSTIGGTDKSTATSVQPPGATPTTAKARAYRILSEVELTGALLSLKDLPAGYSQDPPSTDNTDKMFCDYVPPFTPKVNAFRGFTKGGGMSAELLSIGMRQFASAEEAKAAFDALTHALASCTGETYQGTRLTYAPMSAPKVGDGSVGVKITGDGADLLQFFVLVGPTLINTGGGGLLNASADEFTSLLEAQVNAYRAAAAH